VILAHGQRLRTGTEQAGRPVRQRCSILKAEGRRRDPALATRSEGILIFEKIKPGPKMVPPVQRESHMPELAGTRRGHVGLHDPGAESVRAGHGGAAGRWRRPCGLRQHGTGPAPSPVARLIWATNPVVNQGPDLSADSLQRPVKPQASQRIGATAELLTLDGSF
jgi:hypothetical protein